MEGAANCILHVLCPKNATYLFFRLLKSATESDCLANVRLHWSQLPFSLTEPVLRMPASRMFSTSIGGYFPQSHSLSGQHQTTRCCRCLVYTRRLRDAVVPICLAGLFGIAPQPSETILHTQPHPLSHRGRYDSGHPCCHRQPRSSGCAPV